MPVFSAAGLYADGAGEQADQKAGGCIDKHLGSKVPAHVCKEKALHAALDREAAWLVAAKPATLAGHAARATAALEAAKRFYLSPGDYQPDDTLHYLPHGLVYTILEDLSAAGANLALSAETASPDGDAPLIADCAAFEALEHQTQEIYGDEPEKDAERERIYEAQEPFLERIVDAIAVTWEGHAARARCIVAWRPQVVWSDTGDTEALLLHALLRDLAGQDAVDHALERRRAQMERGANQHRPIGLSSQHAAAEEEERVLKDSAAGVA